MATKPATMPDAAPSEVALPSRSFSTISQAIPAPQVATSVFVAAIAAVLSAAYAEPALKPNQPNHSKPAPSITIVRLCGRIGVFGHPKRLPRMMQTASAAAPALMCTAVPPAKSITSAPPMLS